MVCYYSTFIVFNLNTIFCLIFSHSINRFFIKVRNSDTSIPHPGSSQKGLVPDPRNPGFNQQPHLGEKYPSRNRSGFGKNYSYSQNLEPQNCRILFLPLSNFCCLANNLYHFTVSVVQIKGGSEMERACL